MNQIELERAAAERLFDAALEEVIAAAPAQSPGVARTQRWFAAAILLLGVGVLFAVAVLVRQRDPAPTQQPQQPDLPPAIRVEGRAALEQQDRGAQNLWCVLVPRDLPLLGEFRQLRRLLLEEQPDPIGIFLANRNAWSLAPLAACTRLQSLGIGNLTGFSPTALAAAAQLPELRELKLIGTNHLLDAAFVDAIQKLPLRSLSLSAVGIDAKAFTLLCELPLLERLELRDCLHLDRCDLLQLQRLRQLRSLSLRGVGGALASSLSRSLPLADEPKLEPPPDPPGVMRTGLQMPGEEKLLLTQEVMRAIAKLPQLRELNLAGSVLDDDALAALPQQLTALDVNQCVGLGTRGLMAAPPLPQLSTLGCSMPTLVTNDLHLDDFDSFVSGKTAAAQAAQDTLWQFLRVHHLRKLSFHGPLLAKTCRELETQTALRELELELIPADEQLPIDIAFTSAMLDLERLSIAFAREFDPAPLTKLNHLRRVEVSGLAPKTVVHLGRALGDTVQVVDIGR